MTLPSSSNSLPSFAYMGSSLMKIVKNVPDHRATAAAYMDSFMTVAAPNPENGRANHLKRASHLTPNR